MSTIVKATTLAEATKRIGEVLGLSNGRQLGTALAVALLDEVARNPSFGDKVKRLYGEVAPVKTSAQVRNPQPRMPKTALVDLVPIKHVSGFEFNPAGTMDPYLLHEAFGTVQLRRILEALPLGKLKESAAQVERRNPGTRPGNKSQKASLIEYITARVGAE
jgi:hypothetical protein